MRFSIRDLLWLTLLAAFAVTWWVDRSRLAAEIERLRPIPYQVIRGGERLIEFAQPPD